MANIAVVLFNLGGPDKPESVEPFLFNLFNDKAIIRLPNPFRYLLAKFISKRRAPIAREIYHHLGGGSPILPLTEKQASALEQVLKAQLGGNVKVFIAMRYWHPFTQETVREVKAFSPDKVILLPLYPQFSTTTSGSSLQAWHNEKKKQDLTAETVTVGCYPVAEGFIASQAEVIRPLYESASKQSKPRILFSAHGLPKKIVEAGDPYQWQVEQTSSAIVQKMGIPGLDWVVCYQSKVGRLEWLKPSTDDEIRRAGKDKVPLVVVPVAFVSEHSETLVELDIEYKKLADASGVPGYHRAPALGEDRNFINTLAEICQKSLQDKKGVSSSESKRICPVEFSQCICQ